MADSKYVGSLGDAICFTHGTFHRSSYEDEADGDDVSDAGTERTENESDVDEDDEDDTEEEGST
jgi:hypothetical protein